MANAADAQHAPRGGISGDSSVRRDLLCSGDRRVNEEWRGAAVEYRAGGGGRIYSWRNIFKHQVISAIIFYRHMFFSPAISYQIQTYRTPMPRIAEEERKARMSAALTFARNHLAWQRCIARVAYAYMLARGRHARHWNLAIASYHLCCNSPPAATTSYRHLSLERNQRPLVAGDNAVCDKIAAISRW